jgi:hypothetical protein
MTRGIRGQLTQARLKELFEYDLGTGLFRRRVRCGRCKAGEIAGSTVSEGHGGKTYVMICVDYVTYYAHQLAFLYVLGYIPLGVDHENGDGEHNWWLNLREATQTQNMQNARRPVRNKCGVKGVYWHTKDQRWMARIAVNKRRIFLGNFENIEDAAVAYAQAARQHFGEFARMA